MKVAYLLGSLNRGGTETLLLDVFRNAKRNGLNAIGVSRKSGVLEMEFIQSGTPLHTLPFRKNIFAYLFQLRKLLKSNSIDIVHAQQTIDALYSWIACYGTGIKIIQTFHGYDSDESILNKFIVRFVIWMTDINIYVSENQRKYYQDKYNLNNKNQRVVYNGISFDKFESYLANDNSARSLSRISNKSLRTELVLSNDGLLFGSIGNFNSVRDQMTICFFLKCLNEENINFHFVFVGKRVGNVSYLFDNCLNYCTQNGFSDKVSFLGARNDVPSILSQLDAFVYATNHDTFGIAVVEALSVGIPVFVNDWDVMREITEEGRYATIYKSKDETDLMNHFLSFINCPFEYREKANAASILVRNKYSIENHINALKIVYNELILN